jgi:hypothetical protein
MEIKIILHNNRKNGASKQKKTFTEMGVFVQKLLQIELFFFLSWKLKKT